MPEVLHVLLIEDCEDDGILVLRQLQQENFHLIWERVETLESLRDCLAKGTWDIIISDFHLPKFTAQHALEITQHHASDIPFIVVSGTIGEQIAVSMMKAGAHDYVMKNSLARLPEVVRREVRDARVRRERKQAEVALQLRTEELDRFFSLSLDLLCIVWFNGILLRYNSQWEKTLGYSPFHLETTRFLDLVHPEDRSSTEKAIDSLATGKESCEFINRYRHCDGSYRWIEWRSVAKDTLIYAAGRDVTERKRDEEQLQNLLAGTAAATGQDFFLGLVEHIAKALEVAYALVTERIDDRLHALAFWAHGTLQSTFSYPFVETPCEQTLRNGIFYCESSIQEQFPRDRDLVELSVESYLGIALQDGHGNILGNLCVLDRQPIKNPLRAEQILKIFGARAGAELERKRASGALAQLNQELEAQVEKRTAQLKEREDRYHALMNEASDAILVADIQGNLLEVNHKAAELLGRCRETLIWMHQLELYAPQDLAKIIAAYQEVTQGHRKLLSDVHILRPNGELIPVDISTSIVAIGDTQIIQSILRDVTERKVEELVRQQLIQELTAFKLALDLSASVSITDTEEVITYVNDRFCKLSGYSRAELIGKTHTLIRSGHHTEEFHQELTYTVSQGMVWHGEICNRAKNGQLYWEKVSIVPLLDATDRPFQYLSIRFDITDRKHTEQVIRQQAAREKLLREITQRIRQSLDLQTIFDTACYEVRQVLQADRVAIFKYTLDSQYSNGEFVAESVGQEFPSAIGASLVGHPLGEEFTILQASLPNTYFAAPDIHALTTTDRYSPYVDIMKQFQVRATLVVPLVCGHAMWGLLCVHQCTATRQWQQFEIDFTQQLASQLAIGIQQAVLYWQVETELTEHHKTQQELLHRNQELSRATRLKDEFLANMSHELRTPLNAILGMAEALQEQVFGEIHGEQKRALQTIERSGTHLLELINDILDVAKIESGHMELDFRPTPVTPLCSSSLAFVKQQALQKCIQLDTKIPPNLPELLVDERRVRQVLINLLSNAVKFTPAGGKITLEVSPKWNIPTELQGLSYRTNFRTVAKENPQRAPKIVGEKELRYLRISITDTGIGISAEEMEKLFQPFMQIDSALNRQYSGTGLGLTLVKRIVELHGGEVGLASQKGEGSCFMISLPCTGELSSSWYSPTPEALLEVPSSPTIAPPLILLAEDNEANISTLTSYLKAKQYRLTLAKDGEEAVALAQSENPDLILMDIQMPGMDGLTAIQRIRAIPRLHAKPIIALTALAMPGDADRCLGAGANYYLSKPVKLKQLATTIQSLLARGEGK